MEEADAQLIADRKNRARIAKQKWRAANREYYLAKQNEYSKRYNDENREIILAKKKLYYEVNAELIKQRAREKYAAKKAAKMAQNGQLVTIPS